MSVQTIADEFRRIPRLYPFRRPAVLALIAVVAGIALLHRSGRLDAGAVWEPYQGQRCAIIGVVRSTPDIRPTGVVYEVDAETVQPFDDTLHSARGRLLVHVLTSTVAVAEAGDRVRAYGRLNRPANARTPGSFDYRAFLQARSIGAIAYAGPNGFENLGRAGGFSARRLGGRLERWVAGCFARRLSPESAAVLAGLTVGERPRFFPDVRRAFIESGTMHVLVASGSNVGFLVATLCLLAAALRVPREAAIVASLPVVWLYVLVVGGDAPIARAGTMATLFALAQILGREDRAFHALALAALVSVLLDPASLYDVGLQMSFLTVFGFRFHLPPLEKGLAQAPPWTRWPLRALAASFIAQLWLMPISAAVFHRLYPVSLAANLVIVPAASAGLAVGSALAGLDTAGWTGATHAMARVADGYGRALLGTARFFRDPSGHVSLAPDTASGANRRVLRHPAVGPVSPAVRSLARDVRARARRADFPSRAARRATAVVGHRMARHRIAHHRHPHERPAGGDRDQPGRGRSGGFIGTDPGAVLRRSRPVAHRSGRRERPARHRGRHRRARARGDRRPRVVRHGHSSLFGPWDPHGVKTPAPLRVAGFEIQPLPAPPYAGERPLWISRDGQAALLGHWIELETQGAALDRRETLAVLQARFRPEATWSPAFRRRFHPAFLVDTAGASKEAATPWRADLQRPQSAGWLWWDAGVREGTSAGGASYEWRCPRAISGRSI